MSLTLGMTGMDPATENDLKAAFEQANARMPRRWRLLPEADADYVVVDMDSMYGPMSWLRLHAAGKIVRVFSSRAPDLTALASNADAYAIPHPNIPPYEPWPEPPAGHTTCTCADTRVPVCV